MLGEHFLEQRGAYVFQVADGLFDGRLIVKNQGALDITQLLRHFSDIDLDILEVLLSLHGVVAGFLRVGNDVIHGGAGLVGLAIAVQFVGIAKLTLCDPDGEFGAFLRPRAPEACLELVAGRSLPGIAALNQGQ